MKLLPCAPQPVQGHAGCNRHATLPDGKPYVIGSAPDALHSKGGFIYRCSACKLNTILTGSQWARLPNLTLEDLRGLGLGGMIETDLLGAGLTLEQIEETEAAGLDFERLHRNAQVSGA